MINKKINLLEIMYHWKFVSGIIIGHIVAMIIFTIVSLIISGGCQ